VGPARAGQPPGPQPDTEDAEPREQRFGRDDTGNVGGNSSIRRIKAFDLPDRGRVRPRRGWQVDGGALRRDVLPYDMAAGAVAVTALVTGAHGSARVTNSVSSA
jgi:hypothetical protein